MEYNILYTGCSAGALGVWFHADYIHDTLLNLKKNVSFNYMTMPDAGFFIKSTYNYIMEFVYGYGKLEMLQMH